MCAGLGHDVNDVTDAPVKDFGLPRSEAVKLAAREFTARQIADDQDAADAEFDIN
jgi:hypothetical protein